MVPESEEVLNKDGVIKTRYTSQLETLAKSGVI